MDHLSIKALGPLQITINELPLTGFDSDKVRALLIYLAVEANLPHRREKLANLLWPEYTESSARTNLRQALANLRRVIGDHETDPPYLLISPKTIQINPISEFELDVNKFQSALKEETRVERLEKAVALYKADFLEGFSILDSNEYEDWILITREVLRNQMIRALHRLAHFYENQQSYEKSILHIRQLLDLDPYREEAHQQMMRLLALNGQRAEALTHFDSLRDLLKDDLDIVPSKESISLFQRIHSGKIEPEIEAPVRHMIRGYEVCERIGTGRYGAVYRAIQTTVARDVAIKIILPQYVDQPNFIRLFETEAQIIARLEHPHIVPLYDFWREPGSAFLVMRWMRGGSLKSSLLHGPWKVNSVLRIVDQIALALAVAHRQGVIHRDIKPDNILLDEEGNAFLSDFGIAALVDPILTSMDIRISELDETATGSLGYLPPEVIHEDRISPQADIYSLGIVLYELLIGEHPYPGSSGRELIEKHLKEPLPSIHLQHPEVPESVDQVIQQATAKNPDNRFNDPISLASAFHDAIAHGLPPTSFTISFTPKIQNPYKGLRPFQEADANNFFGRESLIERIIGRFSEEGFGSRFLTVVGPSGSGKSSVVKAGLIPAIRKGALPGSDQWFVIEMHPSDHPFEELETALLRVAINPPESMLGQLQESPRGLCRAVERSLPQDERVELFLVIDQLEELFTLVEDRALIIKFLESICTAITDAGSRLRVITTLRADFYDHPLQYPLFAELVRKRIEVVTPLTTRELEKTIREPAISVGISVEDGLTAAILSEFNEQPGALPLLQYLMTELFEHRDADQLTHSVYEKIGRMHGALSSRAEGLYHELTDLEKEAAHQMFLRLVILRDDFEDTHIRVPRSELENIVLSSRSIDGSSTEPVSTLDEWQKNDNLRESMDNVIELFGKYRLLTFDRHPLTREPTVQIAHHALIKEWPRLREWLDESRTDKQIQRVLMNKTAEWLDANRDHSYLLQGTQLDKFAAWINDTTLGLNLTEREFIQASLADRRAQEAKEMARRAHEQALEDRSTNLLRTLVGLLAVSTIIAIILSLVLFQQRNGAQREIRISTSRDLAQASLTSLQLDPQLSLLLGLQAVENTKTVDRIVLPEAEDALHQAVQIAQPRLHKWIIGPGGRSMTSVAYNPSGTLLAFSFRLSPSLYPYTEVRDILTGKTLWQLPGHLLSDVWLDGDHLATITLLDNSTCLYSLKDAKTGEEITSQTIPLSSDSLGYQGYINAYLSPDGKQLVLAWEDINNSIVISVWDLEKGREIFHLRSTSLKRGYVVGLSNDGKQLFTTDENGRIDIYEISQDSRILSFQAHESYVTQIRTSPDGLLFASASHDQNVILWDSQTGQKKATLTGHDNSVLNIAFNSDGTLLASTCADGTVKLWDVKASLATGKGVELFTLSGHYSNVYAAVFSPHGNYLATAGGDGQILEWDVTPSSELYTIDFESTKVQENPVYLEISPQGDSLIVMVPSEKPTVWDTQTGELLFYLLSSSPEKFMKAAYTPDGKFIIGVFGNGMIAVWDTQEGKNILELKDFSDEFNTVEASPDGNYVAIGNNQGLIRLLSLPALLQTGNLTESDKIEIYNIHSNEWVTDIGFNPTGAFFGVTGVYGEGGGRPAKFWMSDAGQKLDLELYGWGWTFLSITFSTDGKYLATTSLEDPAMIWDSASGKLLYNLTGHSDITADVSFSPDGSRLATASLDNTTKIWDATNGMELFTLYGHTGGITDVVFSQDGNKLYTASMDGTVRAYIMDIDELIELARERVTRQFSHEECLRYLHLDTCPADPMYPSITNPPEP